MKRIYHKLDYRILDDPRFGLLPDDQWVKKVKEILYAPDNYFIEDPRREYQQKWARLHNLVFDRDEHKCNYCGDTNRLEVDHIIPLARGGSNEPDNLQILCMKCNRRKSWRLL